MSDLPPLDQPQAYVVVGPNDQRGPYHLELLIGEVLAGRLYDTTPVWWPGLAEWTTMSGHPALAAEIARRRAGYADPQAFAPPAQSQAPAPGQYQQAQGYYDTAAPGHATVPVSGQDYSPDMYAGQSVAANPAVDPTPAEEPAQPAAAVTETPQAGDVQPAEAVGETQLLGEHVPVEVAGGEDADVPGAAEVIAPDEVEPPASGGPDDSQRAAFDQLVARSGDRAGAVALVDAADAAFAEAALAAVSSAGLSVTDRTDGPDTHEVRCSGDEGEQLTVTLGRVAGQDVASARSSHVPLEVRCTNTSYGGGVETGTGAHGEVVVVADEWSGQATSGVALLLGVADYLDDAGAVDSAALARDVDAVIAVVRHRLR
jgi:hypothetical protein